MTSNTNDHSLSPSEGIAKSSIKLKEEVREKFLRAAHKAVVQKKKTSILENLASYIPGCVYKKLQTFRRNEADIDSGYGAVLFTGTSTWKQEQSTLRYQWIHATDWKTD